MPKNQRFLLATILTVCGITILISPYLLLSTREHYPRALGLLSLIGGILLFFNRGGWQYVGDPKDYSDLVQPFPGNAEKSGEITKRAQELDMKTGFPFYRIWKNRFWIQLVALIVTALASILVVTGLYFYWRR